MSDDFHVKTLENNGVLERAASRQSRSKALLAAVDALADACDKHAKAAACSVDHSDWCETMEAVESAARAYRELRAANAGLHRTSEAEHNEKG